MSPWGLRSERGEPIRAALVDAWPLPPDGNPMATVALGCRASNRGLQTLGPSLPARERRGRGRGGGGAAALFSGGRAPESPRCPPPLPESTAPVSAVRGGDGLRGDPGWLGPGRLESPLTPCSPRAPSPPRWRPPPSSSSRARTWSTAPRPSRRNTSTGRRASAARVAFSRWTRGLGKEACWGERGGAGRRARDPGFTARPVFRCTPRPRASPSGPPGRCPGSGSCLSAGAGTTAPHSPPRCWPIDCVCPGPRAAAARWGREGRGG